MPVSLVVLPWNGCLRNLLPLCRNVQQSGGAVHVMDAQRMFLEMWMETVHLLHMMCWRQPGSTLAWCLKAACAAGRLHNLTPCMMGFSKLPTSPTSCMQLQGSIVSCGIPASQQFLKLAVNWTFQLNCILMTIYRLLVKQRCVSK